ncbi:MAG: PGPGW domain-containing protein [Acidimicrobiia bacterium]|nr:PGPGW domain-containing protein [Acidimicrobiia bacterium]
MESSQEPFSDDRRGISDAARKVIVGSVGGTVTAAGLVMLVTPGPGILVSLAGLGILAREFPGAERQIQRLRRAIGRNAEDDR